MIRTNTQSPARSGRLAAVFGVEPGEGHGVVSLSGLNFAVSTAFVLVQTSAFALFIESFGSHALPYAYFSVAILSSLVGYLYLQTSRRLSFMAGLYANLAFLIAVCLVFWLGLRSAANRSFVFLLPFWFQTLVNLANIVVWHMAGHLFNVRQAKRLFGLIVAGNWVANVLGGLLIAPVLGLVRASDLYLLAAVALFLSLMVLKLGPSRHLPSNPPQGASPARRASQRAGIVAVLRHPYTRLIFTYTILWWLSFFILENLFFHQVESQFESSSALATFLGRQLAVMGVIALVTSSFLTSRIVGRYGLRLGLLSMPVIVALTILLIAIEGSLGWSPVFLFWAATIARTLNVALGFSISQAMGSLLFQPLLGSLRSAAQTVAEGMMQPIAIGVAGLVLLVFNTALDFDAVRLSWVFLVVAIPWFWSIFELSRCYPLVMSEALRKRALGESAVAFLDPEAVRMLRTNLQNPRPAVAIYAINQLEQGDPAAWRATLIDELPGILRHPSAKVRLEALARALSLRLPELLPALRAGLEAETASEVHSALIRILASMDDQPSMPRVLEALDSSEEIVQRGAIVGALSADATEVRTRAAVALQALATSSVVGKRLSACEILCDVASRGTGNLLRNLLDDSDVSVRQAALRAAARQPDHALIDSLLDACIDTATAPLAENALVSHGEACLDIFEKELTRPRGAGNDYRRTHSILRVLGRIQHPRSIQLLLPLADDPDLHLRTHALLGLSRLQYRAGTPEDALRHARNEVEHGAWLASAIAAVSAAEPVAEWTFLAHSLDLAYREARGRALLWLSFIYESSAILRARHALEDLSAGRGAMAMETVDALLPPSIKPWFLPLLENDLHANRITRWRLGGVPVPLAPPTEVLRSLLENNLDAPLTPWARLCAIHVAARLGRRDLRPHLEELSREEHGPVAEMARWAVFAFETGGTHMLSLVEKVISLKSAFIFGDTPDNVLAEIADLTEEVAFDTDQAIFNKGDAGDSLYIIVSGAVKVWDEGRLLNELGEGQVFGELALLDPEPRLATVRCTEPTSLLRLDAAHFREILDSQPEVSAAILRVITRYLRGQLQFAREASARLRALESLGSVPQAAPA